MATLDQRIREFHITMRVGIARRTRDEDGWQHDAYRVELRCQDRTMRLDYRKGIGHHGSPPTLVEVLESVITDSRTVLNTRSFEEWAGELGYDSDSRMAEATYKACVRQAKNFEKLVGNHAYVLLLDETELEN